MDSLIFDLWCIGDCEDVVALVEQFRWDHLFQDRSRDFSEDDESFQQIDCVKDFQVEFVFWAVSNGNFVNICNAGRLQIDWPQIELHHFKDASPESLNKLDHVVVLVELSQKGDKAENENMSIDVTIRADQFEKNLSLFCYCWPVISICFVVLQEVFAKR